MKNKYAQKSQDISTKIKQELIEKSIFMEKNAQIYLEMKAINLNGNGKIIENHGNNKLNAKEISFVSSDSVEASNNSNKKIGMLISCSHRRAGGGWLSGSLAQEENVSRMTTWAVQAGLPDFKNWYNQDCWLGQKGALVIEGLLIFNEKYEELKDSKKVVFAGVASANKAALNNHIYWDSEKGIIERKNYLVDNLICAFEEFERRGVDEVVLCAFGTNVFGWKLEESIEVLHEASQYVRNMTLICAMNSNKQLTIANEIYESILSKEVKNSKKKMKK